MRPRAWPTPTGGLFTLTLKCKMHNTRHRRIGLDEAQNVANTNSCLPCPHTANTKSHNTRHRRIALDEAQNVANTNSIAASAASSLWRRHAWVVTGTVSSQTSVNIINILIFLACFDLLNLLLPQAPGRAPAMLLSCSPTLPGNCQSHSTPLALTSAAAVKLAARQRARGGDPRPAGVSGIRGEGDDIQFISI